MMRREARPHAVMLLPRLVISDPTIIAAANYASSLKDLHSYEEVKSLLRKVMPAARRAFGESHELTIKIRWIYTEALYRDDDATLDDLREAVTRFEDTERIVRRVFGGAHPLALRTEIFLRNSRGILRARETPSTGAA